MRERFRIAMCMGVLLLAGVVFAAPTARIALSQPEMGPADTVAIEVKVSGDGVCDVYLALLEPGGAIRCVDPSMKLTDRGHLVPVLKNWPVTEVNEKRLLEFDASLLQKAGEHTWLLVFTPPGVAPLDHKRWLASASVDFVYHSARSSSGGFPFQGQKIRSGDDASSPPVAPLDLAPNTPAPSARRVEEPAAVAPLAQSYENETVYESDSCADFCDWTCSSWSTPCSSSYYYNDCGTVVPYRRSVWISSAWGWPTYHRYRPASSTWYRPFAGHPWVRVPYRSPWIGSYDRYPYGCGSGMTIGLSFGSERSWNSGSHFGVGFEYSTRFRKDKFREADRLYYGPHRQGTSRWTTPTAKPSPAPRVRPASAVRTSSPVAGRILPGTINRGTVSSTPSAARVQVPTVRPSARETRSFVTPTPTVRPSASIRQTQTTRPRISLPSLLRQTTRRPSVRLPSSRPSAAPRVTPHPAVRQATPAPTIHPLTSGLRRATPFPQSGSRQPTAVRIKR